MNQGPVLITAGALCGVLFMGNAVADEDCDYERELTLDLEPARELMLDVGAGSLKVYGSPGNNRISAVGRACASSAKLLEELALVNRSRGDRAVIDARYPRDGWSFGNRYARIDLEVQVPQDMLIEIDDGSGSIRVEQVAGVVIDDGSGSIHLIDILGDVRIEDGSGSIVVDTTQGSVFLEDGSGGIELKNIGLDVVIGDDGSGGIQVTGVAGKVEIDEDGSGEIAIRDVGGNVSIGRDGSGSIKVTQVDGDLYVGDAGGGSVRYDQVMGKVDVPRDHRKDWR